MQNFQSLLAEAAQIKESQLKQERKEYENLPQYLKCSLGFQRKYQLLRTQHFYVQMHVTSHLKQLGNQSYSQAQSSSGNYEAALNHYQQALAIYRYITSSSSTNMKDDDLSYHNYSCPPIYQQEYEAHLIALYLNISSCLTKMNKKNEAVHAAEEALKIKQTAKGFYRKAQAYLKYINRDSKDIKLGFYQLCRSYQFSKDDQILILMHQLKKQLEDENRREKQWFKFMFDKNSQKPTLNTSQVSQNSLKYHGILNEKQNSSVCEPQSIEKQKASVEEFNMEHGLDGNDNIQKRVFKDMEKNPKLKSFLSEIEETKKYQEDRQAATQQIKKVEVKISPTSLQNQASQFDSYKVEDSTEQLRTKKTKQNLQLYVNMEQEWQMVFDLHFIKKHCKKIDALISLSGYADYISEYRRKLFDCLEGKQEISSYFKWLEEHPMDKIKKYIQRRQAHISWIQAQRIKKENQKVKKPIETKIVPKRQWIHLIVLAVLLIMVLLWMAL